MRNAVIYVRVSTDLQNTDSQVFSLKRYAEKNDFIIKEVFSENISGLITRRLGLDEAVEYVLNPENQIDTLMVWELSRLGRKTRNILNIVDQLIDKKINLFVYNNNINILNEDKTINKTGEMMVTFLGAFASSEREYIIERMTRGREKNVIEKGHWGGGKITPYGYKKEGKKLIIDKTEASVIKNIFKLYLNGKGSTLIVEELIKKNIKTKSEILFNKKTEWSDKVIQGIIKNPIYSGIIKYKNELYSRPELKIIDPDDFAEVQTILKNHYNSKRRGKQKKIFKLLLDDVNLRCGVCGQTYYSHKRTSGRDNVYKCFSKRLKNPCINRGIGIDKLNDAVYYIIKNSGIIEKRFKNYLNGKGSTLIVEELKNKIEDKQKLILVQEKTELTILNLLIDNRLRQEVYNKKYSDIQKKKEALNTDIQLITKQINDFKNIETRKETINDYLRNIKYNALNLKELINEVVQTINIYPTDNYLSTISNDFNYYIEVQTITGNINILCSQRTNKIVIIPTGHFNFNDYKIKSFNRLKVQNLRHHIDWDTLVKNPI